MISRLLVEPEFSIEQRVVVRREFEMSSLPDFLLIYFLKSEIPSFESGTSLLANPNQSTSLTIDRWQGELLIVRIAPELLIETAARLRLYRSGSHLLFRSPLAPLTGDAK